MTLTLVLAALLAADCRHLIDADLAFARETAARGVEGWMNWFAPNASILVPGAGPVRGKEQLRPRFEKMFAQPGFKLSWKPESAECSGDLGYTLGRSEREVTGPDGIAKKSQGSYVTIWRKQPDGRWLVEFDTGN
ncbi:MAG: DUF4440 domain-containing protein [Bryobacter sp.]|jgi:ketosteroid isomerase-like protein|nr:DUF4440 domain-containing protein [Bryobacter sp.]